MVELQKRWSEGGRSQNMVTSDQRRDLCPHIRFNFNQDQLPACFVIKREIAKCALSLNPT
eukprot:scaffold6342_cov206-Alexandrium_tamarense.AAC.2